MVDLIAEFNRPPRVLLVDDNPANIELLKLQLRSSGYDLETAQDGLQALEKVKKWKPDLVLLDLMMPRMSGYEVCQMMKSDKELCFIPIIIVTALRELDDKLKAIEFGADDFLIKPFNKLELSTRIRSLLRLKALYDDLDTSENILFSLAQAIEAKDRYTHGHSRRVAHYCRLFAKAIGLSEKEQDSLWRGGLIHDIGKIGVSEIVLHKPGPLSTDEMEHVRTHPAKGYEICAALRSFQNSLPVIRSHHERVDGSGYPDRLVGDQIPLLAKITSIVDTFDAMTSDRPYRKAMKTEEATRIFQSERDWGQWDPHLVNEFIKLIKSDLKPVASSG